MVFQLGNLKLDMFFDLVGSPCQIVFGAVNLINQIGQLIVEVERIVSQRVTTRRRR